VCWEANRAYNSQIRPDAIPAMPAWYDLPNSQKNSIINGINYLISHPEATIKENHENWLKYKRAEGWVFGIDNNCVLKTSPYLKEFDELSSESKLKDLIFVTLVRAMTNEICTA